MYCSHLESKRCKSKAGEPTNCVFCNYWWCSSWRDKRRATFAGSTS